VKNDPPGAFLFRHTGRQPIERARRTKNNVLLECFTSLSVWSYNRHHNRDDSIQADLNKLYDTRPPTQYPPADGSGSYPQQQRNKERDSPNDYYCNFLNDPV
jgi:hypothetical protein